MELYKVGKKPPDEGILNCKACGRTWKWKDRVNNLPFANPSLLITTLAHKNQSHPVHSNQLSGVDCGANRPFLKLHPVQVQISILKLCILRALQLRNPNLERICSSEQVLGECHGKDSLSLCWVTPTSSSFFYP